MKLNWLIDLVLPIPPGDECCRRFGYYPVALVTKPLVAKLDWQYVPKDLKRIHEAKSQLGLTHEERHENLHDAFWADDRQVNGKTVLLVGDVASTGSMLSSVAGVFSEADAQKVNALT